MTHAPITGVAVAGYRSLRDVRLLHPDLLAPLARLIAQATERSQIVVVSHAQSLMRALEETAAVTRIMLDKRLGETIVDGDDPPPWAWPPR